MSKGKPQNSTHMSKRPPRLSMMAQPAHMPHQHTEQRPDEDEITDWVSLEGGQVDPLLVPEQVKRQGFVVQWKVKAVLGSEDSAVKRRMTDYWRAGWRPVPGERGKGYFFMPGEAVPANIEIGGQVLMERPKHIEDHARKLNSMAAREQLQNKMEEVGMALPAAVRQKHPEMAQIKIDPRPDMLQSGSQSVPE